ncbi:GMC oxidoreductase family [Verrucomicrobiia bacterium DG1235]|nr:GMC oxidoreductase family [Verrucomicrobiae bacterium DG1235]
MISKASPYVIVGGGLAGLALASELVKSGRRCLVVEAGGSAPVEDWRDLTWFDAERDKLELDTTHEYNDKLARVKALGGSCEAWEAYTPRWNRSDFKQNSSWGVGRDWPFGFEELETYYLRSERLMGVAGGKLGCRDEERSAPFPLPAFSWTRYEEEIARRSASLGVFWHDYPQARNSRPYGGRGHCNGIGVCNACPIQARWTPRAGLLPQLQASELFELSCDTVCEGFVCSGSGRVDAVVLKRGDSETVRVDCEQVVLAAGAIECSRLLLLSRRNGVGEGAFQNPAIGKGFMDHPILRVCADLSWDPGVSRQTNMLASSHSFRDFEVTSGAWGFMLNLNRRILPRLCLSAHLEMPAVEEHRVELSDKLVDRFGNPVAKLRIGNRYEGYSESEERAYREMERIAREVGGKSVSKVPLQLWACHPMGGCRISKGESEGVVDPNLRVWAMQNMYVLSNGVFPSGAAVNPSLTLMALALRLGDHLKGGAYA